MNKRFTAIVEEARKLTHEEKRELIDLLHIELSDDEASEGTPEEIEAAWVEEIARRVAKAERGESTFKSADEVFAEIRQRLSRK